MVKPILEDYIADYRIDLAVECKICKKEIVVKVKEQDLEEYYKPDRRHIQHIFPYLEAHERELFVTGYCKECWNKIFPKEEKN